MTTTFLKQTMTLRAGAAIALFVAFCGVYALSLFVPAGWWTFGVSTAALMFILLTAIARVNDIAEDTLRWHIRRLGLLAVAGGCIAIILQTLQWDDFPSWNEVMLHWGFATTWAVTPNMPPWWRFMGQPDPRADKRPAEPQL